MSMLAATKREYKDGRTKQAFKDSTDINKILAKAQKKGGIAHALKYDAAVYGEFEGYDLLEAYGKVEKAGEIFADLPSEVRSEFNGDSLAFAQYASDPANVNRLAELIPALAAPGRMRPPVIPEDPEVPRREQPRREDPPAEVETPSEV